MTAEQNAPATDRGTQDDLVAEIEQLVPELKDIGNPNRAHWWGVVGKAAALLTRAAAELGRLTEAKAVADAHEQRRVADLTAAQAEIRARDEAIDAIRDEVHRMSGIPLYAYGDNEAACEFATALKQIDVIARAAIDAAPQAPSSGEGEGK